MYVCNCSVYIQNNVRQQTATTPRLGESEDRRVGGCTGQIVFVAAAPRHTVAAAGTHTHKPDVYTL